MGHKVSFKGLIEEVGKVSFLGIVLENPEVHKLVIEAKRVLEGLRINDNIAVNGVCLTVMDIDENSFSVNLWPRTLNKNQLLLS